MFRRETVRTGNRDSDRANSTLNNNVQQAFLNQQNSIAGGRLLEKVSVENQPTVIVHKLGHRPRSYIVCAQYTAGVSQNISLVEMNAETITLEAVDAQTVDIWVF